MVNQILKVLRNRNFILLLAILLGLLAGEGARLSEKLVIPSLCVAMTLATMGVPGNIFFSPRKLVWPILGGLAMSYGVQGTFLLGLNALLIRDENLRLGFIIMSAVPPAVAVIPFTAMLKGNETYSLVATLGCYLGALLLMPLITIRFIGTGFVDYGKLVTILVELVILPLILSRVILLTKADRTIAPFKGTVINWSFFVVVYTIVGLNRHLILDEPGSLILPALIALAGTFILGAGIERICRLFAVDRATTTSLVLLGTQKNTGLSAGLSLTLFSDLTAAPSTISTIFMLVYILWLSFNRKRSRELEL